MSTLFILEPKPRPRRNVPHNEKSSVVFRCPLWSSSLSIFRCLIMFSSRPWLVKNRFQKRPKRNCACSCRALWHLAFWTAIVLDRAYWSVQLLYFICKIPNFESVLHDNLCYWHPNSHHSYSNLTKLHFAELNWQKRSDLKTPGRCIADGKRKGGEKTNGKLTPAIANVL